MAYIAGGTLRDKRPWSIGLLADYFWAFVAAIHNFFLTMFSMEASATYGKKRTTGARWGNGGGPGGGGGGGGSGWGPSGGGGGGGGGRGGRGGLDNVRSLDHTAPTPACGSCCG